MPTVTTGARVLAWPEIRQDRSGCAVAPNLSDHDPDARLQEQSDLDPTDVLNYITGLEEGAGIRIPETHYAKVTSLTAAVDYLSRAGAAARSNG